MEWRTAGWSVCLPLLIFPCTIKSRSSLLALAHLGGSGKAAVKRLWWWWWSIVAKRLDGSRCHFAGGKPRPRPHCARWGLSFPSYERGTATPLFSAHVRHGHGRLSQLLLSSCTFMTGQKLGGCCAPVFFWGGGIRSPSNTCGLGQGLPPYQVAS